MRLHFRGSLGIHVVRGAVGTDGCVLRGVSGAKIDSREDGIGGRGLQILRQPETGDVESHAERRQFEDGARIAEPKLAKQIRRKGVSVAKCGGVREGYLVSATVSPFS